MTGVVETENTEGLSMAVPGQGDGRRVRPLPEWLVRQYNKAHTRKSIPPCPPGRSGFGTVSLGTTDGV